MSIQRIFSIRCGSYGWQTRVYVEPGRRLTRFFSDGLYGYRGARKMAKDAEQMLRPAARRIRNYLKRTKA